MSDFNGNEGSFLKIGPAGTLTATFRNAYPSQPKGYFFGINKLNSILNQANCMGIRIYFGQDGSGNLTMVLVGALANNDDMTSGYILDLGTPCPSVCGASNSLNS